MLVGEFKYFNFLETLFKKSSSPLVVPRVPRTHPIFDEVIYRPGMGDEGGPRRGACGVSVTLLKYGVFWELSESDVVFLDFLPFEGAGEVGEDGYYAYEESRFTLELDLVFWGTPFRLTGGGSGLWPIFDFSYAGLSGFISSDSEDEAWFNETSLLPSKAIAYEVQYLSRFRRRGAWRTLFFSAVRQLYRVFCPTASLFFIFLTCVGVGRYCSGGTGSALVLTVSNTADLVVSPPVGVGEGCVVPSGDNPESTMCFFFSSHYGLLRNYAHHVRSQVVFNVYEYRGLLYLGEYARRKVTKQKPR